MQNPSPAMSPPDQRPIKVIVVPSVVCPKCGAEEAYADPSSPSGMRFNIRAFRVDDWSECLKCGVWFDLAGNIEAA